jgi:hypothetical protein
MSSGPAPPGKPQIQALNCPGCGAALVVRSFQAAVTIVCSNCHCILDAQDPRHQILQKFQAATHEDPPLVPLGTRGRIRGTDFEAIGFERRQITVDDVHYSWHEYVLFNPYKGFRYLSEYQGHWNDISILKSPPEIIRGAYPIAVAYLGETYKHFQAAKATTQYVLGEFPWQVRVGEVVDVSDFVSPPRVISREATKDEVTWSMGEYMAGADVWKAFNLRGSAPEAVGVYENQPSPLGQEVTRIWTLCAAFCAAIVLMLIVLSAQARNEEVFSSSYTFDGRTPGEASFVTDEFELKGHTSSVEFDTSTNVDNKWIYLNYALINQDTGEAFDFGREVSYYHGYDSDGSWSEGSSHDTAVVPSVPPGHYYVRVEPESEARNGTISYRITIKRDAPQLTFYGLGLLALLLPAGLMTWRSMNFEHLRWAESDYAPEGTGSSGNDGDDD